VTAAASGRERRGGDPALCVLAVVAVALTALPFIGLPAFYESFIYLAFHWIALATSWSVLSGYAGYFSFGHGAFFGAGMYTTSTLTAAFGLPFLATLPIAALVAALLAAGIGAVVFRVKRLRGELFGLLTLAITFVLATIVLNTPIDGGPGVYLSNVPIPKLVPSPNGTIYLLGLVLAVATLATARIVSRSRFGLGLFAISDDEDVAEVKGVPTFRYKLLAFALSAAVAGAAGGTQAIYVGYVTVGETFAVTVPLYVVLMSILGGARHWLGPAAGAVVITASLYAFTSGERAIVGRAIVAFALVVVILLLPQGVVPTLLGWWRSRGTRHRAASEARAVSPDAITVADTDEVTLGVTIDGRPNSGDATSPVLDCRQVWKSFGGIQALRGVDLAIERGAIVGLVGPNGSGKTTLINVISGHYRADRGEVALGPTPLTTRAAHEIAHLGVARTYQVPRPFARLSVVDNVALAATFGATPCSLAEARNEASQWLEFTGLQQRARALPGELNLHERKFLELARVLAARPRVILLDEVLSGLNPAEIGSAIRLIQKIREAGASILFVEHVIRAVVELSDRVTVLNEGQVIASGSPREAMRDPRVMQVYLGTSHVA